MTAYAEIDPETGEFKRIHAGPVTDSEVEQRQTHDQRDLI